MKRRQGLFYFALIAAVTQARAFTPESGFYNLFSSDAKGREGTGIAIEIQNDYMFAAGFVFRTSGTPTYVTIEGQLQHRPNGSWGLSDDRGLAAYAGGQCIGTLEHCPYRTPSSSSIGGFAVEFTAENEGTLTWGTKDDLASVTLRRTCVGSICYDAPSSLLGEWDVILDDTVSLQGLHFGGDKLAVAQVTPSGETREISGCVARGESAAPDCANSADKEKLAGTARRCSDGSCPTGSYRYRIEVYAANCEANCKIVRTYTFSENGNGGAFGGTIRGRAGLCPKGASTIDVCAAGKTVPFVAYRSGSVNFVRSGDGTN